MYKGACTLTLKPPPFAMFRWTNGAATLQNNKQQLEHRKESSGITYYRD